MTKRQLLLYGTSACHLCEQAEALIRPLLPSAGLELELVDISADEHLLERYGVHIPVLGGFDPGHDWLELRWPFDVAQAWSLCAQVADLNQG